MERRQIESIFKDIFVKGLVLGFANLITTPSFSQTSKDGSWFEHHQQGWHWYKKMPKISKPKKLEDRLPVEASSSSKLSEISSNESDTYVKKLKEIQEKLEESQAKAVLSPTVENVVEYKKFHDAVINQSSKFQEAWMYASLLTLNPKDANFSSPKGREIQLKQEQQELEMRIRDLSRSHGLFFVFKQSCPYCHEFSPVVKAFAQKYGFEIKAISADGGMLPEFPDAEQDNGVVSLINPEGIYPALYIVNPVKNTVFPISWGMINEVGLKDNIKHYLAVTDKENQQ